MRNNRATRMVIIGGGKFFYESNALQILGTSTGGFFLSLQLMPFDVAKLEGKGIVGKERFLCWTATPPAGRSDGVTTLGLFNRSRKCAVSSSFLVLYCTADY